MLWRRRLGGLVRRGLGLVRFGCGMGLRRRGIQGRSLSFVGCVAGVVVGGVGVGCFAGGRIESSLCFGGRVGLRRGWLARCLGRPGRARVRCVGVVEVRERVWALGARWWGWGAAAGYGGMEVVRLRHAASCMELSTARMPSLGGR